MIMAMLESSGWITTLFRGANPRVRANDGLRAFSNAAFLASNGATPSLVTIYRSYKAVDPSSLAEVAPDPGYDDGALADGGGDTLDGAGADVADRKDAGRGGFIG